MKPEAGISITRCFRTFVSFLLFYAFVPASQAQALPDAALANIKFEQKLDSKVTLTLPFRDENGTEVRLGQYFGQKPVVLVLGYYECPMLCTLVLNGMVESAQDVKWSIGHEYE